MLEVASVVCISPEGRFLIGLRNDTGKWALPGGKIDYGTGEDAAEAAEREVEEETGLVAEDLEYLGKGPGAPGTFIYCFRCHVVGTPTSEQDPDKEFAHFVWLPWGQPLPDVIAKNLYSPNNVTLKLLGLIPDGHGPENDPEYSLKLHDMPFTVQVHPDAVFDALSPQHRF